MNHFESSCFRKTFHPTAHDIMGLSGIPLAGHYGYREQYLAWMSANGYAPSEVAEGHYVVGSPGGTAAIHLYGARELAAYAYREGMSHV